MKKHLLMHVWPRVTPHDTWRITLGEVKRRWGLFDGRKTVAVAGSHDAASVREVRDFLPRDPALEVFGVPNDPALREVATFVPLMETVRDQEGATFYCHGKGSTHHATSICQEWGRTMCEVLLDHPAMIDRALERHDLAGCFRQARRFGMRPDNWHFSGTFFWFRNDSVFRSGLAWHDVDPLWFGTESWPGKMYSQRHAACAFLDWCGDLYSEEYWSRVVRPSLERWRQSPAVVSAGDADDECEFERLAGTIDQNVCLRCRKIVHDVLLLQRHLCGAGPGPRTRQAAAMTPPRARHCAYLGTQKGSTPCVKCGPTSGKTAPVYACHLLGECVLYDVGSGHKNVCESCGQFTPGKISV